MILRKEEIVRHRVKGVLQTEPFTHITPGEISITTIQLFVELENDTIFDFSYPDSLPPRIHAIDRTRVSLLPADFGPRPSQQYVGERILEIAFCDWWPYMGVLLSNGRFITLDLGGDVFYASLEYTLETAKNAPADFRSYVDNIPLCQLPPLDLKNLAEQVRS
jgi:hypothetical protein